MEKRYEKPPISEAVIELRFQSPVATEKLSKLASRLLKVKKYYSFQEPHAQSELKIDFQPNGKAIISESIISQGFKLFSIGGNAVIIMANSQFIISQSPPYCGWEELFARLHRDWGEFLHEVGAVKVARVGVRFINRIDIKASDGIKINLDEYFNYYPKVPDGFVSLQSFVAQATLEKDEIGIGSQINIAPAPSPVIGYVSFVLDIDTYLEGDMFLKLENIRELFEKIRKKKNDIFETCITEKTRGLFS